MDFKKLAEVELLDKAPEGATAFAEVNGEVKRVAGGIGGSTGYVWDVTDKLKALIEGGDEVSLEDDQFMVWHPTEEEAKAVIQGAMEAGGLTVQMDLSVLLSANNEGVEGLNGVYAASGPQFLAVSTPEGAMVFVGATLMGDTLPIAQIDLSVGTDHTAASSRAKVMFPSVFG